jgi:hypothetical protein
MDTPDAKRKALLDLILTSTDDEIQVHYDEYFDEYFQQAKEDDLVEKAELTYDSVEELRKLESDGFYIVACGEFKFEWELLTIIIGNVNHMIFLDDKSNFEEELDCDDYESVFIDLTHLKNPISMMEQIIEITARVKRNQLVIFTKGEIPHPNYKKCRFTQVDDLWDFTIGEPAPPKVEHGQINARRYKGDATMTDAIWLMDFNLVVDMLPNNDLLVFGVANNVNEMWRPIAQEDKDRIDAKHKSVFQFPSHIV